jgi:NAD(P)H-hydrate epimerase
VLGGSASYPGAGILAALAGARAGAGYVTLATPEAAASTARAHLLSIPVVAAAETDGAFATDALPGILGRLRHLDAITVGPGICVTAGSTGLVRELLAVASVPLVLDADALNIVARLAEAGQFECKAPVILTPHAGELQRLYTGFSTDTLERLACALGNAVVVAKGPVTSISDGRQTVQLDEATVALAKAGTGDVLAGILGALVAQGMAPFDAAVAGVRIHSLAGRVAAGQLGVRSVMAEDVCQAIATAISQFDG